MCVKQLNVIDDMEAFVSFQSCSRRLRQVPYDVLKEL